MEELARKPETSAVRQVVDAVYDFRRVYKRPPAKLRLGRAMAAELVKDCTGSLASYWGTNRLGKRQFLGMDVVDDLMLHGCWVE